MTRPTRLNRTTSARALAACTLLVALTLASTPPAHAERSPAANPALPAAATPALAQPAGSPIGRLDSLSARLWTFEGLLPQDRTQLLFGWAADPDSPGQPVQVHIYADGQPYQGAIGPIATTGAARPDVQTAYPWAGPDAGFSTWLLRLEEGTTQRTFCACAINVGPGANTTLGCVVAPSPFIDGHEPLGTIDTAHISPGMLTITGWAGDPDADGEAVAVRVSLDGGRWADTAADDPRPDVAAAFPGLGGSTGFSQDIPFAPGLHHLCLEIGNVGRHGLHNRRLGCAFVQIPDAPPAGPHDPMGHVDEVSLRMTGWYTRYGVAGWAADPDSPGPVEVRLLSMLAPWFFDVTVTTGTPRPDVQTAVTWAGAQAGFGHPDAGNPVCAYATQVGDGTGATRFLGCGDHGA